MKKIIIVLILGLSISLSSFVVHKFYVSVTQVDYNEEQKSLQIISRVFIDDVQEVLRKRYDDAIRFDQNQETPGAEKYLGKYFAQKLKFTVNEQDVQYTFLGKEYEDDLLVCYLEIENIQSLESIEISNQFLMDLFEEQQNIIHVKKGKQRKSLILEKDKDTGLLKFSK